MAGGTSYPLVTVVTVPFLFLIKREMAKLKHQYSIDELKHREAQMQTKLEEAQARLEELAEHKVPHRQLAWPGLDTKVPWSALVTLNNEPEGSWDTKTYKAATGADTALCLAQPQSESPEDAPFQPSPIPYPCA